MATEPTLGERIMDAALEWAGVWARVKADDRDSFEDEDEAHERLRALAARADAAERLAKAQIRWNDMPAGSTVDALWDAQVEVQRSDAAWRAIEATEVPL